MVETHTTEQQTGLISALNTVLLAPSGQQTAPRSVTTLLVLLAWWSTLVFVISAFVYTAFAAFAAFALL